VSGLSGHNISTAKQDDLRGADVVLTVGEHVFVYNPVLGFKVRRAVQGGATWVHVGTAPAAWKRMVTIHVDCTTGEEAAALRAVCGAIVAAGAYDAAGLAVVANGQAFLSHAFGQPGPRVAEAAAHIADASKKVILAVNQDAPVGSDHADVRWTADLALLTGRTGGPKGGLLVVKNDANGQGVQDVLYGGGFTSPADLTKAKSLLDAGAFKAVVLLGVDPAGIPSLEAGLAAAQFTAAVDLFKTTATEQADVVVPLCPIQEEDGSVVSFDGRITPFRKAFKPLAGFSTVEFLSEVLAQAGGERLDLAATRQAIAGALPLYRTLGTDAPTTAYLCDQTAARGAAPRFSMAPVSPGPAREAYQPATTFSRVVEARLRADLKG
jgi:predicted molibdopterin-dependent oxidoreductase YjgC